MFSKKTIAFISLFSGFSLAQPSSQSNTKEEVAFSELTACLKDVPIQEIKNDKFKRMKLLVLTTSALQNITYELGTISELNEEYAELYPIAYKYCFTQIDKVKSLSSRKG